MSQNKMHLYSVMKRTRFATLILIVFVSVWVLSPLKFPFGIGAFAQAANVSFASDVLSTSAPSTVANHTITFTTPTGIVAGNTITITFPPLFTMSSIVFGDVDLSIAGVEQTLGAVASVGVWGVSVAGQVLTLTSNNGTAAAASIIIIRIGKNATSGGTGTNQITNSVVGSYPILIGGTMADTGKLYIAIVSTVTMTASVDTSFSFTVSGVGFGSTGANSEALNTSATTTSTTIPWGSLVAGTPKTARQDIQVVTNSQNGFAVTLQQNQPLTSGTGAIINNFKDGASTTPATTWTSPLGTLGTASTYGHFGITSSSVLANGGEFTTGGPKYAGNLNTPKIVLSNTVPSSGTTGAAQIGFKIEITALQAAGNDYTNTLTYVATPVF